MNIHNKSKQRSTKNVLSTKVNIVFRINTNSSLADGREDTDLSTLSDFTIKIIFEIQGGPK